MKAIETIQTVETAITRVPVKNLVISPLNVRKKQGTGIEELAALIASQGLIHNLVVTEKKKGRKSEKYEVVAGARRLAAHPWGDRRGSEAQEPPGHRPASARPGAQGRDRAAREAPLDRASAAGKDLSPCIERVAQALPRPLLMVRIAMDRPHRSRAAVNYELPLSLSHAARLAEPGLRRRAA